MTYWPNLARHLFFGGWGVAGQDRLLLLFNRPYYYSSMFRLTAKLS